MKKKITMFVLSFCMILIFNIKTTYAQAGLGELYVESIKLYYTVETRLLTSEIIPQIRKVIKNPKVDSKILKLFT